jgi:hypothetical protein
LYFIIQIDLEKYLSKNNYRFFFQKEVVLSGFTPKHPWAFRVNYLCNLNTFKPTTCKDESYLNHLRCVSSISTSNGRFLSIIAFEIYWNILSYTINTFKYILIQSILLKIHWCLINTLYYHIYTIVIYFHILIYIHIYFKYIPIPFKNLTYFWHLIQYHYHSLIPFHILPYTLKLS